MKHLLLVVLVVAAVLSWPWTSGLIAADNKQPVAASPKANVAASSDFVGSETCAACHADVSKNFDSNPHSRLALMHGGQGATCESCHGPGKAHVDGGGDVTKIFRFTTASAKQIDAKCLGCHAQAHPDFARSEHAKANVSCTNCHSVHEAKTENALLKVPQPQLCFQCHSDVKAALAMPFHHPVKEGAVTCSDCHDAHGTFEKVNLKSTADQNMICTKCHVETRGPFVYEHAPVKAEGCLSCHSPHGSQNARLLNMPAITPLCKQCHSQVAAGTFHSMGAGSSESTPCTSCHTMIHGSNLNQAFLK